MAAVEQWNWSQANELFDELVSNVKNHMAMEDEVLYPAYESLTELPQEPIRALKDDHVKIIRLIGDLNVVLETNDSEHILESMIQFEEVLINHHEREENIFLPMAGYFLRSRKDELLKEMQDFEASLAKRK
jgi:hemerythrin-like domain-containing protein